MSNIVFAVFRTNAVKTVTHVAILAGALGRVAGEHTKRVENMNGGASSLANTATPVVEFIFWADVHDSLPL